MTVSQTLLPPQSVFTAHSTQSPATHAGATMGQFALVRQPTQPRFGSQNEPVGQTPHTPPPLPVLLLVPVAALVVEAALVVDAALVVAALVVEAALVVAALVVAALVVAAELVEPAPPAPPEPVEPSPLHA